MIGIALSFMAGIAASHFFPFFPISIAAALIIAVIFLYATAHNRRRLFIACLMFGLGVSQGFMGGQNDAGLQPSGHLPDIFSGDEAEVSGTVIDLPELSKGRLRFTLSDVVINGKKAEGRILLLGGAGSVTDERSALSILSRGDTITGLARLKEPSMTGNPGVRSYDIRREGIFAIGYLSGVQVIQKGRGAAAWISRKRQALGEVIDRSLAPENAALHKAVIPGLKRGIGQNMRDAFGTTGLAHLLSISGTHFGLLAFIIFQSVKTGVRQLPRKVLERLTLSITPTQIAILATMPVLGLYAVISGASTPTVRSFIMVSIYLTALFIGRRRQWLNSLSVAALIILLWNPEALFELSFQFSFLAVFSIGFLLEERGKRGRENEKSAVIPPAVSDQVIVQTNRKIIDRVTTPLFITLAAVLGTAPVVALVFNQFPLISPLTNVILTPVICFVLLPLGFFTGFTALIFNMDIMPLNGVTDWITHTTLHMVKVFSEIPYAGLRVPKPSFVVMVLYFLSLFMMVKWSSWRRFVPVVLILGVYMVRPYLSTGEFRVTFLDVGQGDAALVETPDKEVILVDGGHEGSDAGRRVIAPYLWSKGIRSIDYLVVSHPHLDHYGGLFHIIDNFDIREVWFNGRVIPEAEDFFREFPVKGIPLRTLRRGDLMETGEYRVTVLHPYDDYFSDSDQGEISDQNNDSLVLKVESGGMSVLFTGDIEVEAEENMMHLAEWVRSDIIKVPHHGGRGSSSGDFLGAVDPDIAVISAGRHNSFGHPHEETLRRYEEAGVRRVYRTDRDGAIIISSAGEGYDVRTYRDYEFQVVKGLRDEVRNLGLLL